MKTKEDKRIRKALLAVASASIAMMGLSVCATAAEKISRPKNASTAQTKPGQTLRLRLELARQLAERGDSLSALQMYQLILEEEPKNEQALLSIAALLINAGYPQDAHDYIAKLAALRPHDPAVLIMLGAALNSREQPEEALAILAEAEKAGAAPSPLSTQRGIAYDLLARPSDAQIAYSRAINTAPQEPALQLKLALSLALDKDYLAALQILQRLANNAAIKTEVRRVLALVYALSGQGSTAVEIAKTAFPAEDAASQRLFYEKLAILTKQQQALAVHFNRLPSATAQADAIIRQGPARETAAQTITETGGAASAPKSANPSAGANSTPGVSSAVAPQGRPQLQQQASQPSVQPDLPVVPESTPQPGPLRYWVQLVSTPTRDGVQTEWVRLRKKTKGALNSYKPYIQIFESATSTHFLLLIGPFDGLSKAKSVASELTDKKLSVLAKQTTATVEPLNP